MRVIDRFIIYYGSTILLSALVLIAMGVQQIEIYYTVYLIEFLAAAELIGSIKQSFQGYVRPIMLVFLLGFIYTLLEHIIHLLI